MRAAWYERQGPARSVLQVGELPVPEPAPGEVRVRVAASGIHVGDTGKRQGHWGSTMAFPRVVPHGDGAGVVDAVGRAAVASALHGGATVVAAVRSEPQLEQARALGAQHAVLAGPGMADRIAQVIGRERLDLAADVAFDANIGELHEALRYSGEIATYASVDPEPRVPFWPLGFKNVTVRFLSNDDFPEEANQHAARDLTAALADGTLHYPVRARYPLDRIAEAHEDVERGSGTTRVILEP